MHYNMNRGIVSHVISGEHDIYRYVSRDLVNHGGHVGFFYMNFICISVRIMN